MTRIMKEMDRMDDPKEFDFTNDANDYDECSFEDEQYAVSAANEFIMHFERGAYGV